MSEKDKKPPKKKLKLEKVVPPMTYILDERLMLNCPNPQDTTKK